MKTAAVGASFVNKGSVLHRFKGANYHKSIIEQVVLNEILNKPWPPENDAYERLEWNLSAFFSSLFQLIDYCLQLVTATHKLPIARPDITYEAVSKETAKLGISNQIPDEISRIRKLEWYSSAIAHKRYITHWAEFFTQVLVVKGRVVALKSGQFMHPNEACVAYLKEMKPVVDIAMKTLPDGDINFP